VDLCEPGDSSELGARFAVVFSRMTPQTSRLRPLLALAVGALIFATGAILARQWLPE